ncbi:hypothetical protein BGX24_001117, partial [Mortierella sp. AD032]
QQYYQQQYAPVAGAHPGMMSPQPQHYGFGGGGGGGKDGYGGGGLMRSATQAPGQAPPN